MMKLIATKSMRFAGQSLNPGDSFEASERNARLLKAIGKADDAPAQEIPRQTKAVDPLDHDGDGRKGGSKKGTTYKRRDMRADGED